MLQAKDIKLAPRTPAGRRRINLLSDIDRSGPVKMTEYN